MDLNAKGGRKWMYSNDRGKNGRGRGGKFTVNTRGQVLVYAFSKPNRRKV